MTSSIRHPPTSGDCGAIRVADPVDPVVYHLQMAMRAAVEAHGASSRPFVDRVGLAIRAHLAVEARAEAPSVQRGALSLWQQVRARELLASRLDVTITIHDVARACGLSRGHFVRAFKQTTGLTPHRWRMARRLDIAKRLMLDTQLTVAEVAVASGFADQSHLSRIFRREIGESPGAFRRAGASEHR
ncbi:MAG: Transcriptional regulator, AraC family [Labilithrix sp.]|nr:Transcriptional regulator, AraC family [Labilithrix sp.]